MGIYGNFILENYVFGEKDLEYNLNKWKVGQKNVLFITGLSGSGKSTKASKLSKENNAINIEMDLFEYNQILFDPTVNHDEGNLIMKKYFEKRFGGPNKFPVDENNIISDWENFGLEVCQFINHILQIANKNKNKLYVVEGIQIIEIGDKIFDEIEDYPVIVVGTSMIRSIIQAAKREGVLRYFKFDSLKDFKIWLKWYLDSEKSKKIFSNKISRR